MEDKDEVQFFFLNLVNIKLFINKRKKSFVIGK